MRYIQNDLRDRLCRLLKEDYKLKPGDIQFSIPPDRKFGDLSTTLPFLLAKQEGEKPFVVGNKIIEKIGGECDFFSDIKLAGGGFLNFFFKKGYLLKYLIETRGREIEDRKQKVVVEHTSINPNKSAHIGHLRNACLGDTLVKSLGFLGYEVEIQNYIDDTGIQIADVVWGLLYHRQENICEIKKIENIAAYLWGLYSEVNQLFEEDAGILEDRQEVHKKLEERVDPEYKVGDFICREVLKDHLRVMEEIGIRYHLLVRERDIIELDFFKEAADILRREGIMYLSADPEKKGCWVIKYDRENIEKVIIRSNQTVTYIGKDIAYTLWKMGLFKKDFYYRLFDSYRDSRKIFITDFLPGKLPEEAHFGDAVRVYNVIDVRQSYLQRIISQVLARLAPPDSEKKFIHFSYEMVALTPRCVKELGFEISSEDEGKPYLEVSGRKGMAVKADELIEELVEKSREEVKLRNPAMNDKMVEDIARKIAVGALRYFMIKFNANSVIAFDFKDALAFEGDTGPYLQYTLVRIKSILKKMGERDTAIDAAGLDISILDEKEHKISFDILLELSLVDLQVEFALDNSELSAIANYTYSICQKFNHYYHLFPVLTEKNPGLKKVRRALVMLVKGKLERLFEIIGIPVPEKM